MTECPPFHIFCFIYSENAISISGECASGEGTHTKFKRKTENGFGPCLFWVLSGVSSVNLHSLLLTGKQTLNAPRTFSHNLLLTPSNVNIEPATRGSESKLYDEMHVVLFKHYNTQLIRSLIWCLVQSSGSRVSLTPTLNSPRSSTFETFSKVQIHKCTPRARFSSWMSNENVILVHKHHTESFL